MKQKTLRLLLIIFVVLTATATFEWWSKLLPFKKTVAPIPELALDRFTEGSVDSFIIKKGSDEKKLTKSANGWLVNSVPATPSAVRDFFGSLGGLTGGDLVSKNVENHASFGVTETEGYQLRFTQGSQTTSFTIGNSGPDYRSFYIKRADSANVYLISGSLRDSLSLNLSAWQATASATSSTTKK